MEKANTLATVKGVGRVVEVSRNFYDNLNALRENFAKVISGRQEAIARMETAGAENIGKSYGTYINSGFEYAKGQMPILRLKSRLRSKIDIDINIDITILGIVFRVWLIVLMFQ